MNFAFKKAIEYSEKNGITATAIKNIGHTGRLGYYADYAANKGLMTILISGGKILINNKTYEVIGPIDSKVRLEYLFCTGEMFLPNYEKNRWLNLI